MFRILLTILSVTGLSIAQPGAGSIQGTVTDAATKKPIPQAIVSATRTTLPPLRTTVRSGVDGSFLIGGLPAGSYTLCAQAVSGAYLDPCLWNLPVPTVTLAAGQESTGALLAVPSGSILKIHLEDPHKLLNQKTKTGYLPHLSLGIHTPRGFYPAHLAAASGNGADYQMTIPRDTPLVFSVQSFSLQLADANDAPLAGNRNQQAFQHASGNANPPGFSYKITGVLP